MTKRPIDETIGAFYDTLHAEGAPCEPAEEPDEDATQGRDEFMEELAKGASEMATDIDHRISAKSAHWKLERMPVVDRNILRLAIYEFRFGTAPVKVVIDEALELGKKFSSAESPQFLNGILDAAYKKLES